MLPLRTRFRVAVRAADRDRRPAAREALPAAVRRPGAVHQGFALRTTRRIRRPADHGRRRSRPARAAAWAAVSIASGGDHLRAPLGARRLGQSNGSAPRVDCALFLRRAAGAPGWPRRGPARASRYAGPAYVPIMEAVPGGVTGAGLPASKGPAIC